jgi:sulfate adenylyltransferase subunit 1
MDGGAFRARAASFEPGEQIRFMTAGSVDDGKSTLIGRLLLDTGALMRDETAGLKGDDADLALLTDGLEAERAQGITIDVAYRYFATPRASFIIADAPGHEQYTRNMVTAASVSDVAVIVIDAARVLNGELKPQTRRHAAIAALMGVNVIVAVNKMDAVAWSQQRFEEVRHAFAALAAQLGLTDVAYVPVSAKRGDNVVNRGGQWWAGPTLLELIQGARADEGRSDEPLRLPVQIILRDFERRYYAGRIEAGSIRAGDKVVVGPRAYPAIVASVRIGGQAVASAGAGDSVAIEFSEERDVSRGDVIAAPGVRYVRGVAADLCWLDEHSWSRGRRYILRHGALETQALIERVDFVRDIGDFSESESSELRLNDIARVAITTADPILSDVYAGTSGAGAFVLFDPQTNQTCAAGMIRKAFT